MVKISFPQALKLSHGAFAATGSGHIVDLVGTDADKLKWVCK